MPQIAIDTNAYVAYLKNQKQVVGHFREADSVIVPYIVIAELYHGFFRGSKATENLQTLNEFLSSPRMSVIYPDEITTLNFGEIATELANAGKPMQQNDIWIAAICKQHGYPLLTLDNGFRNIIGLKLLPLK